MAMPMQVADCLTCTLLKSGVGSVNLGGLSRGAALRRWSAAPPPTWIMNRDRSPLPLAASLWFAISRPCEPLQLRACAWRVNLTSCTEVSEHGFSARSEWRSRVRPRPRFDLPPIAPPIGGMWLRPPFSGESGSRLRMLARASPSLLARKIRISRSVAVGEFRPANANVEMAEVRTPASEWVRATRSSPDTTDSTTAEGKTPRSRMTVGRRCGTPHLVRPGARAATACAGRFSGRRLQRLSSCVRSSGERDQYSRSRSACSGGIRPDTPASDHAAVMRTSISSTMRSV